MAVTDWFQVGKAEIGRVRRRLRSQLNILPGMPSAAVVYHEEYCGIERYIADSVRARKICHYLQYEGCLALSQIVEPKTATISQLSRVHDFTYLSRLYDPSVGERIFGQGLSEEALKTCVEQQRLMTGGTLRAARMALSNIYPRRIIHLGGGFHHAYPDGGYAFCVFNDVAVAIAHLREHHMEGKILVIDLDLHQGDGTRQFFAHDERVFTYSVHAENWNREHAVANCDIALGPGFGDKGYLDAIRASLPEIVRDFDPDLVFYLAGVDVAEDDNLGDWRISHDAIFARDQFVDQAVGKRNMVVLTAGGYGPNAWRHSARFFGYLLSGLSAPVESTNERLLQNLKKLSRSLSVHKLTSDDDDDIFGDFMQPMRRTRLFDFYSKYGIECALEATGIFAHLRSLGYVAPYLEFDLNHPNGQAIRLYGEQEKTNLLMECIIDEKRCLGHLRMLWIEWLLLQNPQAAETPERPLLPGQTYPGLGCLTKVVGMLFMLGDRLQFDAIGFNPAHYHVCFLAKGQGVFETPEAEARFRIAQNLTAGLNIQKASQCLHDGLIREGNVFKWTPARMLIPMSSAAKAHFDNPAFSEAVEKCAAEEIKKYGEQHAYRYKKIL